MKFIPYVKCVCVGGGIGRNFSRGGSSVSRGGR